MFLNLGNCIYKEKSPRFMKLLLVKNLPNEPLLRLFLVLSMKVFESIPKNQCSDM